MIRLAAAKRYFDVHYGCVNFAVKRLALLLKASSSLCLSDMVFELVVA